MARNIHVHVQRKYMYIHVHVYVLYMYSVHVHVVGYYNYYLHYSDQIFPYTYSTCIVANKE